MVSVFSHRIIIEPAVRLHLNLVSMQEGGSRINGGIGFAVKAPSLKIIADKADSMSVHDEREQGLSNESEKRLLSILEAAMKRYEITGRASISIIGNATAHHGFGTGTAIRMACLEALLNLNNTEISPDELVALSGRGGTSGIGVYSYFDGGLVVDLGRKNNGTPHVPSSQADGDIAKPLLLQQCTMPEWDVGICIPAHIKALSEEKEKTFFKKTCPISEVEAHKALYYAVAGVYSSVQENDKSAFEHSIREIQTCAWKRAEREEHGEPLLGLERELYKAGANAVGMSSLGPSLFLLADDVDDVFAKAQIALPTCEFIKTKPANSGRIIKYA